MLLSFLYSEPARRAHIRTRQVLAFDLQFDLLPQPASQARDNIVGIQLHVDHGSNTVLLILDRDGELLD